MGMKSWWEKPGAENAQKLAGPLPALHPHLPARSPFLRVLSAPPLGE